MGEIYIELHACIWKFAAYNFIGAECSIFADDHDGNLAEDF